MKIQRGDIYIADLPFSVGSEQGGTRPVLVVQNNIGNSYSPVVIIATITGRKKPDMPTHIKIKKSGGLSQISTILLEDIKTIDKSRLGRKITHLDKGIMKKVDKALEYSLGLAKNYPIELVLCPKCLEQFRWDSNYRVWRVKPRETEKNLCTYCGIRQGYDYFVLRK